MKMLCKARVQVQMLRKTPYRPLRLSDFVDESFEMGLETSKIVEVVVNL